MRAPAAGAGPQNPTKLALRRRADKLRVFVTRATRPAIPGAGHHGPLNSTAGGALCRVAVARVQRPAATIERLATVSSVPGSSLPFLTGFDNLHFPMPWQLVPAAEFKQHATQWDDLLARCGGAPLLESVHLLSLLTHHGSGKELLAMQRFGFRITAMCIVVPSGQGFWKTFQPSTLPVAPWLSPAAEVADAAHELISQLPGLALGLHIGGLNPYMHPRSQAKPFSRQAPAGTCGFVDISERYDQLLDGGRSVTSKVKRQRDKLAQEGIATRLRCSTGTADVMPALREFAALARVGRHAGAAEHSIADPVARFTDPLVAFCAKGRGRIYRLYFGDRVVAMDLCVDNGSSIAVLATAYDETFRSASPFTLMRFDQMQEWAEEGQFKRLELYGRVLQWYGKWRHDACKLYSTSVYRWPLLRSLHGQFDRGRGSDAKQSRPASAFHG